MLGYVAPLSVMAYVRRQGRHHSFRRKHRVPSVPTMRPAAALFATLASLAPLGARGQTNTDAGRRLLGARVDTLMGKHTAASTPGAGVLVVQDGHVVLEKGYGLAVAERRTPIRADTRFLLASVSKQFTAMGIMILEHLRVIAPHQLAKRGGGGGTLNTTGLIHEAYLKLVDQSRVAWSDRAHFSRRRPSRCDTSSSIAPRLDICRRMTGRLPVDHGVLERRR